MFKSMIDPSGPIISIYCNILTLLGQIKKWAQTQRRPGRITQAVAGDLWILD
jgi:hypothetical protein